MYLPASFAEEDRSTLVDFIDRHGFATLISGSGPEISVSHLPLLVDTQCQSPEQLRLMGHMARANPHWREWTDTSRALAIFHGPHAYTSPAWYVASPAVPTWNYVVVHVHGRPRLLDADETAAVVWRTVEKYEGNRPGRWNAQLPDDFVRSMLKAIVGFELSIERIEGKFKLGQNRSRADRAGMFAGLESQATPGARELASFARGYLRED